MGTVVVEESRRDSCCIGLVNRGMEWEEFPFWYCLEIYDYMAYLEIPEKILNDNMQNGLDTEPWSVNWLV